MILIDFEERLIALNDEANAGVVWEGDEWRPIAPRFAAKAWAEGDELNAEAATRLYPDADQARIPAFVRALASDPYTRAEAAEVAISKQVESGALDHLISDQTSPPSKG